MPVYALSVIFWVSTAYLIVTTSMKLLSRFVSPIQVGEGLFDLSQSVVLAAIGSGLWMLGRFIRTSHFKKQPQSSTVRQP